MTQPKITASSDNIIYLDFDGTLTGIRGSRVINTPLCVNLKDADSFKKRSVFKNDYLTSNDQIKITNGAKQFLNEMNALYPKVQIVIVSRNFENYIRALLEFEEIDTSHITIYPRGEGREMGPGEDKRQAVVNHEKSFKPGLRFICDDDENDFTEMRLGAKNDKNEIIGHNEAAGHFKWLDYLKEILQKIQHILPVSEYLDGRVKMRFHLFPAKTTSITSQSEQTTIFRQKYKDFEGDDLKRAILFDLKETISAIDDIDDLLEFKKTYLLSPEYELLSKGQGLTTYAFGLRTDSQQAVDLIFSKQETAILEDRRNKP